MCVGREVIQEIYLWGGGENKKFICGGGVRTGNVCVCGEGGENKKYVCVWGGGENKKFVCVWGGR